MTAGLSHFRINITWRSVVFHGGFVTLYAAGVVLSDLLISSPSFRIAPIWPPAGIGFACILLGGVRAWPAVSLGAIVGQYFSVQVDPVFFAFALIGNTLAPIVAVLLLRRLWPGNLVMIRLRNGLILFIGGVVLAAVSAAMGTIGALQSGAFADVALPKFVGQWFLGDVFGVVICAPALLSIGRVWQNPHLLLTDEAFHRQREKLIWLVGVLVSAFLWVWLSERSPTYSLAITFLPLIFLGWSALRFDHLFTTLGVMVIMLTSVAFIGRGMAGFAPPDNAIEGAILLLFFAIMGILPLMVSAAAHQSRYYAAQLSYRANHDHLTGLPNRNAFEDYVREALNEAQLRGQWAAVCYLDLDNFKVVNDTCGHTAGDELLKQIAHVLRSNLDGGDNIARLGGDEFGLVFRGCDVEQARERALRLIGMIEEFRFVWRRHIFTFTASCGLAMVGRNTESFTRVLADADAACFDAKEMGGNRVMQADMRADEDSTRHSAAMQWAVRIADGLENDGFELYCQELVPLRPNAHERTHFEVLLRLRDEGGRLLLPSSFIPPAERFKLMPRVDRWVIQHTLGKLARNADLIHRIQSCSINLSGPSLSDSGFFEFLDALLRNGAVPPGKLCFEITETAAIGDLSHAMAFIEGIRSHGCRFALDDFGSGLSSFGYLRALHVDFLKIDGTFVRDIVDNPVDRAMVRSINEVGHVMGKQTIGEYVETPGIADVLREIGVDYAQGYAFGQPLPMERFLNQRVREDDALVVVSNGSPRGSPSRAT